MAAVWNSLCTACVTAKMWKRCPQQDANNPCSKLSQICDRSFLTNGEGEISIVKSQTKTHGTKQVLKQQHLSCQIGVLVFTNKSPMPWLNFILHSSPFLLKVISNKSIQKPNTCWILRIWHLQISMFMLMFNDPVCWSLKIPSCFIQTRSSAFWLRASRLLCNQALEFTKCWPLSPLWQKCGLSWSQMIPQVVDKKYVMISTDVYVKTCLNMFKWF